jgi:hypothetical protein
MERSPSTSFGPANADQNNVNYNSHLHLHEHRAPALDAKALNKIMTAFLWIGTNMVQGGKCLVAWKHIQRPLHLRGLGVLDLDLFGMALHAHWLWLHRMDLE